MELQFNIGEVFDLAIEIERNGAEFYRRFAEHVVEPQARKQLLELVKMEEDHRNHFVHLKQENTGEYPYLELDPHGEVAAYMRLFVAGEIFDLTVDNEDVLTKEADVEDVLNFAIERERESVLFYVGIQRLVPNEDQAEGVSRIISEEMDHVAILSALLRELKSREGS